MLPLRSPHTSTGCRGDDCHGNGCRGDRHVTAVIQRCFDAGNSRCEQHCNENSDDHSACHNIYNIYTCIQGATQTATHYTRVYTLQGVTQSTTYCTHVYTGCYMKTNDNQLATISTTYTCVYTGCHTNCNTLYTCIYTTGCHTINNILYTCIYRMLHEN